MNAINATSFDDARNWEEDRELENGNYINTCASCNLLFMGHKRRTTCKACDALVKEDSQEVEQMKEEAMASTRPYYELAEAPAYRMVAMQLKKDARHARTRSNEVASMLQMFVDLMRDIRESDALRSEGEEMESRASRLMEMAMLTGFSPTPDDYERHASGIDDLE